jgi:hypothetical protein
MWTGFIWLGDEWGLVNTAESIGFLKRKGSNFVGSVIIS